MIAAQGAQITVQLATLPADGPTGDFSGEMQERPGSSNKGVVAFERELPLSLTLFGRGSPPPRPLQGFAPLSALRI